MVQGVQKPAFNISRISTQDVITAGQKYNILG